MPTYVEVKDYDSLYWKTRDMRPEIRRAFQRRLRNAAGIGARASKAKVLAWPVHSRFHSGLRADIAGNIRTSTGGGSIRIVQRDVHRNRWKNPPRDVDSGRWRHPVFGTDRWVSQRGTHYFFRVIQDKRLEMRRAVDPILDEIARMVITRDRSTTSRIRQLFTGRNP
jgi:hypothetical protein